MNNDIKEIRSDMHDLCSKIIQKQFDKAANTWLLRNPKRKLKLVSGMGAAFYVVDGDILQIDGSMPIISCNWEGWKNYGISGFNSYDKQKQVFKELYNVTIWLWENLERHESESDYLSGKDYN